MSEAHCSLIVLKRLGGWWQSAAMPQLFLRLGGWWQSSDAPAVLADGWLVAERSDAPAVLADGWLVAERSGAPARIPTLTPVGRSPPEALRGANRASWLPQPTRTPGKKTERLF